MRTFKKLPAVATSMIGSLATAVIGQGTLLVSGVLAARMLGPEDRGHLALLALIPAVICQIVLLGVKDAVTYYIARDRGATAAVVRIAIVPALVQMVLCGTIHAVIVWLLIGGDSREVQMARLATLVVPPAVVVQNYGLAVLQGMSQFRSFNVLRLLQPLLYSLGLILLLVVSEERLAIVAVAWSATHILTAATVVVAVARTIPAGEPTADVPTRNELIRFGAKGFLGSVSPLETFRLDQAVVGFFLSPAALGIYVASLAFTNLPRLMAYSVGMVALPHIAKQQDDRIARRSMWRFFWLTLAGSTVVVIMLGLAAPALVPFLLGDEFRDAVNPMRILLIGSVFFAVRRVLGEGLRARGRPSANTVAEVASWCWLVPALALLHTWLELEGVAIALVSASVVSLGVLLFITMTERSDLTKRPSREGRAPTKRQWPTWQGTTPRVQQAMFVFAILAGAAAVGWISTFRAEIVFILAALLLLVLARHYVPLWLQPKPTTTEPTLTSVDTNRQQAMMAVPRVFYYLGVALVAGLVIRVTPVATLSDWFFLAALLSAIAVQMLTRKFTFSGLPQGLLIGLAIFASGAFLSSLNSPAPVASIAVLVRFGYLVVSWFWLGTVVLQTMGHVKTAIVLWTGSVALSGAASLAQLRFGDVIPGTTPSWGRMTGLAQHFNDLGSTAAVAVVPAILVPSLLSSRFGKLVGAFGILPLVAAALLLAGSVGAMFATSMSLFLWFVTNRVSFRAIVVTVVAGSSILLLLTLQQEAGAPNPLDRLRGTTDTNSEYCSLCQRLDTNRAAWDAIGRSPIIGAGMTSRASTGSQVHNMILGAWFEAGFFGAIGLIAILGSVGLTGVRAMRDARSHEEWSICLALLASFLAFIVVGMATPILFQRFGWIGTALLLVVRHQQLASRASATAPSRTEEPSQLGPRPVVRPQPRFAPARTTGGISPR